MEPYLDVVLRGVRLSGPSSGVPAAALHKSIFAALRPGATPGLSHGFLLGYLEQQGSRFPEGIDVIAVCPKGLLGEPLVPPAYGVPRRPPGFTTPVRVARPRHLAGSAVRLRQPQGPTSLRLPPGRVHRPAVPPSGGRTVGPPGTPYVHAPTVSAGRCRTGSVTVVPAKAGFAGRTMVSTAS
jgi:hypothetical protein